MKVTYAEVIVAWHAVQHILRPVMDQPMPMYPAPASTGLKRLVKALVSEYEVAEQQRADLIKKHGGAPVPGRPGMLVVPAEQNAAFVEEWALTEKTEIEFAIPMPKIKSTDFGTSPLCPADLIALDKFIEDA
jgi:hypothetical protein